MQFRNIFQTFQVVTTSISPLASCLLPFAFFVLSSRHPVRVSKFYIEAMMLLRKMSGASGLK